MHSLENTLVHCIAQVWYIAYNFVVYYRVYQKSQLPFHLTFKEI